MKKSVVLPKLKANPNTRVFGTFREYVILDAAGKQVEDSATRGKQHCILQFLHNCGEAVKDHPIDGKLNRAEVLIWKRYSTKGFKCVRID